MNIWQLVTDLFIVTFLGLLIAFSPMLIVVNLLIVLKSKRPILHAVALILGILSPLILVAGIGFLFINPSTDISLGSISAHFHLPPIIYMVFGASILSLAMRQALKPPRQFAKVSEFHIPNDNFWALYGFGFMKSLLSATNLFAILVVVSLIVQSSLNPMFDIIILVWTLAVGMIPFGIVLYLHRFREGFLVKLNKRLNQIIARSLRRLIIVSLYCLGSFFIFKGLLGVFR